MGKSGRFAKKVLFFRALAVIGLMGVMAGTASAQFAASSCDTQYYQSLEARAWLEAQREVVQNQNLIFKPDSVLQYTCFDRHLSVLVSQSSNLLTGNSSFNGNTNQMRTPLNSIVLGPTRNYLNSNFNHSMLGGRTNINYNVPNSLSAGNYSCNMMDRIWMQAKCMNFIHQTSHDGFFTFNQYANNDFRTLPTTCGGGANGPFTANLNTAVVAATTPWVEDTVNTYLANIYPTGANNACGGVASRVPTGVVVQTDRYAGFTEYNENICLVSGCKYVPTSRTNGCCSRGTTCPYP